MFGIVTVVSTHASFCDSGTLICFVLLQWYVYMLYIVTMVFVHVLYFESGTRTCYVL
jgi:hypothetical protein